MAILSRSFLNPTSGSYLLLGRHLRDLTKSRANVRMLDGLSYHTMPQRLEGLYE